MFPHSALQHNEMVGANDPAQPRRCHLGAQQAIPKPAGVRKAAKKGGKRKRSVYSSSVKKQKWFDSFGARKILKTPETGIHSLQWAINIAPQESPLFTLPLEVRQRIFTLALMDDSNHYSSPILEPHKCGKKFVNKAAYDVVNTYRSLSVISRQVYLDVIGSGLLHRTATFNFASQTLMSNYLARINPSLKAWINHVDLNIHLSIDRKTIPKAVFTTLLALTGLTHLSITLNVQNILHLLLEPRSMQADVRVRISSAGEQILMKIEEQEGWKDLAALRLKKCSVGLILLLNCNGGIRWKEERCRELSERIEKVVLQKPGGSQAEAGYGKNPDSEVGSSSETVHARLGW